jgi:hypothetical protein
MVRRKTQNARRNDNQNQNREPVRALVVQRERLLTFTTTAAAGASQQPFIKRHYIIGNYYLHKSDVSLATSTSRIDSAITHYQRGNIYNATYYKE